jgi:CheY-like chemotaxis protein
VSDARGRRSILVVDDLAANRDLLMRRLDKAGFHAVGAADGASALDTLGRGGIDLVLLDIMMPGMTGLDVLRRARETWSPATLPVIMVTAKTQTEDLVEALGLGANDYVTKPVDFPAILARIHAHLRTRDATREEAPGPAEPKTPAHAVPGSILGGRYRLTRRIGGGSYGTVYEAHHLDLDRNVAVKVLATSAGTDPEALARFEDEGKSACRVRHPNAVTVLDFNVNPFGVAYLVMELLEGRSLDQELEEKRRLGPARSVQILVPICAALGAAHAARVVHRDVKPSNVYLHQTPSGETPKILDFGIAKIVGEAALQRSLTVDGSLLGTPAYMAPERFRRGPYGPPSDVYSLGTILYEMLGGRLPFLPPAGDPLSLVALQAQEEPMPLRVLCPDLPPGLDPLVRSALAKDPAARPTAAEFAERLAAAVARP